MPLALTINGKPETLSSLDPGASLAEAVTALTLKSDRVAIEHNGEIAPRTTWPSLQLHSGDRLEIVHFVGGG